ncbi:MAG: PAS domain-containing protein [Deltaproteobacteria bacterium]|nr:PAS domain-containing protein [Deltaproteobacteria bacterium]
MPWKHSLVAKFFFSYTGIVLLLLGSFFLYSGGVVKTLYLSFLGKKLQQEAKIVSRLLPPQLQGEVLDRLCRLIATDLGVRLTIIAPDGKVLGDSEESSPAMENHGTRPEVREALTRGTGESIRYSTTVGYEMLYQAIVDRSGPRPRILRLSVPLGDIEEVLGAMRRAIFGGLVLISTAGLVFAYLFSRRLGHRVGRIADFSKEIALGSFPQNFSPGTGADELTLLEQNLNEMSLNIRNKIKEILAEKEKIDSILRCMIEGLVVIDTRGTVVLLNDNARRMFHLAASQSLSGASFMEVSRHPEMKKLVEEVLACDCSRECFSREVSLDEGRWFRVNAVSLRDGDERPLGYILVFHDITEIKRLETVRADFVANVSHELRTPLTAIRGYIETLLRNPPSDPEESQNFLAIIQRHSERLGRLIDDLLTLSDLESGKIQLAKEEIEASDLIRRVEEIFKDQASKKRVVLSHQIDPELPTIVGDPDRLQQLLINLVDNAVKYTASGGQVKITACAVDYPRGAERGAVEVAVVDTGCGIPEKDLPRLTERFYRVDKARSRELGGTGLGLAIVKHIVQAHHGHLTIKSKPQQGTTVSVTLPGAVADKPRTTDLRPWLWGAAAQESSEQSSPHSLAGRSVVRGKKANGVLFLCTANSCRSQMAEGFARALAPEGVQIYSAGTAPKQVHLLAIRVMEEAGIDISRQRSKGIEEIPLERIDLVVTLCGEAEESCPAFPGKPDHLPWPLPDPARAEGTPEQVLQAFRQVRDEIRARVEALFAA